MKRAAILFLFALFLASLCSAAPALPSNLSATSAARCTAVQLDFLAGDPTLLTPSALEMATPPITCNTACGNQQTACKASCGGNFSCVSACKNTYLNCLCACEQKFC
jgi:hypothetical protein